MNRTRQTALFLSLLFALFGATACPGNESGGSGGGDPTLTAERDVDLAIQTIADAICEGTWACFDTHAAALVAALEITDEGVSSLEKCKEVVADQMTRASRDILVQSVKDGRVQIRRSSLGACAQALHDDLCTNRIDRFMPPECRNAIAGFVEPDQPCLDDFECADQGLCLRYSLQCYGTCHPLEHTLHTCGEITCGPGESCTVFQGESVCFDRLRPPCLSDADCEIGSCDANSRCDGDITTVVTIQGEGETCIETDTTLEVCELGLFCDWDTDGLPVCRVHGSEGDPCTGQSSCEYGLYCDAGVCQPRLLLEVGEPCESAFDCRSLRCMSDGDLSEFVCAEVSVCELPDEWPPTDEP